MFGSKLQVLEEYDMGSVRGVLRKSLPRLYSRCFLPSTLTLPLLLLLRLLPSSLSPCLRPYSSLLRLPSPSSLLPCSSRSKSPCPYPYPYSFSELIFQRRGLRFNNIRTTDEEQLHLLSFNHDIQISTEQTIPPRQV